MFEFDKIVLEEFKVTVKKTTLKEIYNETPIDAKNKNAQGKSTKETKQSGIYALFYNNELKKIGRAITGNGIFTRMSQYYRMKPKDGGLKYITEENKDEIQVWYFSLHNTKDCWAAEKYLQAKAYYAGEEMAWDDEISTNS